MLRLKLFSAHRLAKCHGFSGQFFSVWQIAIAPAERLLPYGRLPNNNLISEQLFTIRIIFIIIKQKPETLLQKMNTQNTIFKTISDRLTESYKRVA